MDTMRALQARTRSDESGLRLETDVPVPAPGTGDVLIAVRAASYTPGELDWPSTWVDRSGHDRTPVIPGHEVSGVVAALGWGAAGVAVGEEVFGLTDWYRDGALAEYVTVEARNLARKPERATHAEAAALTLAGLTAYQALLRHGDAGPGKRVLVVGADGGVGSVAVQLARAVGAHVVGLARPGRREAVLDLGAHEFVAAGAEADRIDLIVDTIGGEVLAGARTAAREDAAIVSIADPPSDDPRDRYFVVEPDRRDLAHLARFVDEGAVRGVVGLECPLDEAAAAIARKAAGGVVGKVVVDCA